MTEPWPQAITVAAARTELMRAGAITDGFHGVRVETERSELLVFFRWRSDPNTYCVRIELPVDPPTSPWTGEPVGSAEDWVSEVSGWLTEELQTGLVRRAGGRVVAGVVELDPDSQRWPAIVGYQVSASTSLGRVHAVSALTAGGVGLMRTAHLLIRAGLIGWLIVYVDNAAGSPIVGQAAIGWVNSPAGLARLDLLDVETGVPVAVCRLLILYAVHEAAEAGAKHIVTDVRDPSLTDVGFRSVPGRTGLTLDTTEFVN